MLSTQITPTPLCLSFRLARDMSFVEKLLTDVKALAQNFSISESRAFAVWFAKTELELDDYDAFDALSVEGPNEKGMDVFSVDQLNQRIVIAQCKYSETRSHYPSTKDLSALLTCVNWLESPGALESEGRSELLAAAREYKEAMEKGYSVQLWFVYCGRRDENIEKEIRVFNQNKDNFDKNRKAIHCDIGLLESIYQEIEGQSRRIPYGETKVDSQRIQVKGAFGRGIVTTITGPALVSLYESHGDDLFARNVRGWLGARKGSVNASIIDTVDAENERGRFWAYNNGITIVCDKYNHRRGKLRLWNFSIVNGCQTTVALFRTKDSSLSPNISLLLRVISPPREIIDSIIRFTNSQNTIRRWDLVSQDRTQKKLQTDFGKLHRAVYYVLRRGDWRSLSAEERSKYCMRIRHDLLAQYMAAFKGLAVIAYKEKGLLFDKYYDTVFSPDLRVEEALFIWSAGERVQEIVGDEIRKENDQIEKGDKSHEKYLLMLKRGGRFFALSIFELAANLRNGPDYLRSMTEERITSNNAKERIDKYARFSVQIYKQAMSDLLETQNQDLSVLIRNEDFSQRLSERARNLYGTMAVNTEWLEGALPKLH